MTGLKPSKKSLTPQSVKQSDIKVIRENVFRPDSSQVRAKVRFYQKTRHMLTGASDMDVEQVAELIGEPRILNWWKTLAFVRWFKNEEEHQERVDYLFSMMLNNLEDLIVDPEERYSSNEKLAAQRQLLELRKQMQDKENESKTSAEDIQKIVEAIRLKKKNPSLPPKDKKVELPT